MRKATDSDALVLVLLAAGVAAVLAARSLPSVEVPSLDVLLGAIAGPVAMVGALAGGLAVARLVMTRRVLHSRIALAVVPADEFDPSPEAVLLWASQLGRVRRNVRGWLDRRASAVRIRLASDPQGRLAYVLEVPDRAASLVRSAVRGLEGVELRDADRVLDEGNPGEGRVLRAELVLARASVEPLERLELDPDPLGAFASAIKLLRSHDGERAVVCVDLLPAAPGEARRLRRRLLRQARHTPSTARGLLDQLRDSSGRGRAEPAELVERRAETRALDAKLKDAGALFHLQVLIRCQAVDPARGKATLRALLAGFDQFAGRNWLRPVGVRVPGLAFLGSDLPLRRRWLDHRMATGLFRPARRSVVTAREIACLLKPPTVHCHADNVLRSGALVAAAPALPDLEHSGGGLIPLGRIVTEHGDRLAGVRIADTFFSYVAGRSRYGKSELAIAQFVHLAREGHGGLFLDPHEDALRRIAGYLDHPGSRERIIEINLARPAPGPGPAWNLFELTGADEGEAERKVEAVVDAFASALGWEERNNRALTLTTQAAQALAAISRPLPRELAPTIFQLPTLLSEEQWRDAVLPFLPQASQRFWTHRFPRLSEEAITPVTNLIDRLRASTQITALLGQSQSTYRIREAMDHGLIVLACPGSGGTRDRLIANLLVFDLLHAAKARAELAPEQRRPFWVFLDEVQTYDGASSGNLAALLEQTAKYGVRAFLLNQNPERLTAATLNAVTTNRSHLLATALNARAAGLIAKEWAGQPDPAALTRLPRYRFLAQVTHHGELTKPFQVHGLPADELLAHASDHHVAAAAGVTAPATGLAAADTLAHLETLDARILEELTKQRRHDAREQGASGAQRPGGGSFDIGPERDSS